MSEKICLENDSKYLKIITNTGSSSSSRIVRMDLLFIKQLNNLT